MNERRGQTSLEYVVTYGWAFLVLLVVIGALAYFGVITPSKWVPDKCDFGSQLDCVDYQLNSTGTGTISLDLRNNFGKNVTITGQVRHTNGTYSGLGSIPNMPPGVSNTLNISGIGPGYLVHGQKQQVIIRLLFSRVPVGMGDYHNVTGLVYATVI